MLFLRMLHFKNEYQKFSTYLANIFRLCDLLTHENKYAQNGFMSK